MLTLSYLLIVAGSLLLAYWALDARFHLTHKFRKWQRRRYWLERNEREQRHRKLKPPTPPKRSRARKRSGLKSGS